jgi:rod shape determining protein RodA
LTTLSPTAARPRAAVLDRLRGSVVELDWILLAAVGAVTGFGLFVVKEATATDVAGDPSYFFSRQLTYTLVGIVALLAARAVSLERLARWYWPLWCGLVVSVAAVFLLGTGVRGSNRWIDLGSFRLQPSELGKVALIIVLAALVAERAGQVGRPRFTALAVGVTVVPATVVFAQPDLGTGTVYFVILTAILFMAGLGWTHFAVLGALAGAVIVGLVWLLPAAGVEVLKPYQVDRLTAFVDSGTDLSDSGYQLEQSKTAVGSGGATGKGLDGATQTINDFLPEHHTDFVFAVVAEMFGFLGAGVLILAYALLLWRGLRITARAPTQLDMLVGSAIVAAIGFQVFVNIGMTIGIMPITGIPLPFMSYGGSHTLTNLIAVGLLLRIHQRRVSGIP